MLFQIVAEGIGNRGLYALFRRELRRHIRELDLDGFRGCGSHRCKDGDQHQHRENQSNEFLHGCFLLVLGQAFRFFDERLRSE